MNLFEHVPASASEELVSVLLESEAVRIERIVSTGQKSAEDFWYDQEENEWVVVLQGEAKLQFADESELRCLKPGDSVHILAHRKHRVASTSGAEPTIWLAVFYN
ncbi:MAG: phosphoribosylaminoimidazole carboxylase [Blastopirellula sp.]|nr:MAG: phosphoribosylaminoimidazole carboxylase [Blastopirellula sp.]